MLGNIAGRETCDPYSSGAQPALFAPSVLQVVGGGIGACRRHVRIGQQVQRRIEGFLFSPSGPARRSGLDELLRHGLTGHPVRHRLAGHDVGQRAEGDAAVEGIGHHRRVVGAVVEEVMGDLRPAGAVRVELGGAAVHQVGGPDQGLSLLCMEVFRLGAVRFHQLAPHRFVDGLRRRAVEFGDALADVFIRVDRPAVAAREVHQRAVGLVDVFHRHPDAAHEALRARAEVDRVGVEVLLGADREVQGLEGPGLAAVQAREQGDDVLVAGDAFDVFAEGPGVLDAQADAGGVARGTPVVEVVMAVKFVLSAVGHVVETSGAEVDDGEPINYKSCCDSSSDLVNSL